MFDARVGALDDQTLVDLAQALRQDCVSLYQPTRDMDVLVGPRAARWVAFDLRRFQRFSLIDLEEQA